MNARSYKSAWLYSAAAFALLGMPGASASGQTPPDAPTPAQQKAAADGVLVDQVLAIVNGNLILESDVDDERRFEIFQPLGDADGKASRQELVNRLIDRSLILQEAKLQPDDKVTIEEARAQLQQVRKDIPACKPYHCEIDAGWQKFVQAQGFTLPEVEERWQERMQILKFTEIRFRSGIRIDPAAIKTYYDKTLLPEYARLHAAPPALDTISDRIQEILLQQQVGNLLNDWLTSLKAQGNVRIMKPDEEVP